MAKLVEKKVMMSRAGIIGFQLLAHCYIYRIKMSDSELKCLTLLGLTGKIELAEFCEQAVKNKIFGSSQTVRNFVARACNSEMILKTGKSRKKIQLNPELGIECEGTVMLDLKAAYIVPKES